MTRAVFLDLNGTLVMPVKAESPGDYRDIEGALKSVRILINNGFLCPVITVQSRIAKGVYSEQAFLDWFAGFRARWHDAGATLLGPYVCPHRFGAGCDCAKPKPLLYHQAAAEHGIDCSRSYVVGDTAADVRAAAAIGADGCLVLTGWGARERDDCANEAAFVGNDLTDATRWILEQ